MRLDFFDWVTEPGKCKKCGAETPLVSDGKPLVSCAPNPEQGYVKFAWICRKCETVNLKRVDKPK